jgi:E3 ubiquitin-protein ligase DOA10
MESAAAPGTAVRQRLHAEPEPEETGTPAAAAPPAENAECRICGEEVPRSQLVVPCGCRGGSELAHQVCVQTWIGTKATANLPNAKCEVCVLPPGWQ